MRIAVALLLLAGAQDKTFLELDELPRQYQDQVARAIEAKDWTMLVKLYEHGLTRHGAKVARSGGRYVSTSSWLESACEGLPIEFLWEFEFAQRATLEETLKNARAGGAWELERLSRRLPYARDTRPLLAEAGSLHLAADRPRAAIRCFRTALARLKADDVEGRAVLIGRLAQAAVRAGDDREVAWARVTGKDLKADVIVDGKSVGLQEYLGSLSIPSADPVRSDKSPSVPEAENRVKPKPVHLRNDILRGTVDLVHDRTSATMGDHPTGAASAVLGGRSIVVVTDGLQAVALDPGAMVPGKSGVLWRHPEKGPRRRPVPKAVRNVPSMSRFGATIAAGRAYVTLFAEDQAAMAADGWDGCRELACFDALTGRLVWQSDPAPLAVLEFAARNWAFTGAPVVVGGTVVAAVVTAPPNVECHVVGFEAATGRIAWSRYLASARVESQWPTPPRRPAMAACEDVVTVATNLGVVVSLQAASGDPLWAGVYEPEKDVKPSLRGEGPPVMHRTGIYVLPQDASAMLRFDPQSGESAVVQITPSSGARDVKWRSIHQLIGTIGDWIVLGGEDSYVVNLVDRIGSDGRIRTPAMKAYSLPRSSTRNCGRSVIDGQSILISVGDDQAGRLSIYYGAGSFKNLDQRAWASPEDRGNLVPAGDHLVVASAARVAVYCGIDTLRAEYTARLAQSPPDLKAWSEYTDLIVKIGAQAEVADVVAAYRDAAKGDAAHEPKARRLAAAWFETLRQEGIDARNSDGPQFWRAAELWRAASKLAPDEAARVELDERRLEALEQCAKVSYKGAREAIEREIAELRKMLKRDE